MTEDFFSGADFYGTEAGPIDTTNCSFPEALAKMANAKVRPPLLELERYKAMSDGIGQLVVMENIRLRAALDTSCDILACANCAAVEKERDGLRDGLESVKAALGDRLLAHGPLSEKYAHSIMRTINALLRDE